MPIVYRIQCNACGRTPETIGGVAGYVTTDGRKNGVILPDTYLSVLLDSGESVPLPHPLEGTILSEQGFTWRRATKEGRLFRVRFKVCKRCGAFSEERRRDYPRAVCI